MRPARRTGCCSSRCGSSQGGDLRRVLEREGALPPGRAAEFISPVASALDAAHAAGLVHRDVKPANILVDARPGRPDHVYLSDFGVSKGARAVGEPDRDRAVPGHPGLFGAGADPGPGGGRADRSVRAGLRGLPAADRAVPFERDQGMAVLLAHLSEPPPSLGARRPDLPAAADQVLARALAKVPEKRYGSCGDFADALREALGLAPYHSPQPRPRARSPAHRDHLTADRVPGPAAAGTGKAAVPADLRQQQPQIVRAAAGRPVPRTGQRQPKSRASPPPSRPVRSRARVRSSRSARGRRGRRGS